LIANIGYFALVITFVTALYGAGAAFYGATQRKPAFVESARHAMILTFPLLSISSIAIIILLVTGRYEYEYVARVAVGSGPRVSPMGHFGFVDYISLFLAAGYFCGEPIRPPLANQLGRTS
jgi:hypothetical protein